MFLITAIYALRYVIRQASSILMEILNKYQWLIIFLPLLIGIFSFRKLQKGTKYIFYFVAFGTLTELTTRAGDFLDNTMPVGHVYIPVSFLLAGIFYVYKLEGFVKKKVIIGIIVLFEIFAILNALIIQGIYSFASLSGALSALILIGFSVLLFAKIMTEAKIKRLIDAPDIWLNSAVLIYYTSNFFFYILYNILLDRSVDFLIQTITIFKFFMVIFYILIAIGFWKAKSGERNRTNSISVKKNRE